MSSKLAELEGQLSGLASRASTLQSLVDHPGWPTYLKLLEDQANSRKGAILLQPLKSTEALYEQEFSKGEISGLTLAQVGIYAVIAELKSQAQTTEAKLENEREIQKRVEADGGGGSSRVDQREWHGGDSSTSG